MVEYGVQDDGTFNRKPVDVIRDEITQDFEDALGSDFSLRDSSIETQIINAVSLEIANQWNALEGSYYSSFYEDAYGAQLDKKLAQVAFQRQPRRGATGEVRFSSERTASQDITIPEGTRVRVPETDTNPPVPFKTIEDATLSEGETSVSGVEIEALEVWETDIDREYLGENTNVSADTITEIANPIGGVSSVTNPRPTGTGRQRYTEGQDRETDAAFKNRYQRSFGNVGDATQNAIQANLVEADSDIVSVDVEQIYDTSNDKYGANVRVLAPGVGDDVIAQAIFDSMAVGVISFGSSSGTAEDNSGDLHTEKFDRATGVEIKVEATVTTDETYSDTAENEITDRIIRYIGGTDTNNTMYPGLLINEDVVYDQVFRRIMNQNGVVEAELDIAKTGGSFAKNNIAIGTGETARTKVNDITITEA